MAPTVHGGAKIGETKDVIEPPNDLKLPIMRRDFDGVLTNALHDTLTNLGDDEADLPAAIRWFEIAWANSAIVDAPTRVMALRAAFDSVFESAFETASTQTVRDRLCALLDPAGTAKTHRRWTDHRGRSQEADLSDLGWWFQSFALLRNKVAHGGALTGADLEFEDGVQHVWHAEWTLRRVFKADPGRARAR